MAKRLEAELPISPSDLEKLPRWAAVTLAARGAARVRRFSTASSAWERDHRKPSDVVGEAILLAEQSAARGQAAETDSDELAIRQGDSHLQSSIFIATGGDGTTEGAEVADAEAAGYSARAAGYAARSVKAQGTEFIDAVWQSLDSASHALVTDVGWLALDNDPRRLHAIKTKQEVTEDFAMLLDVTMRERWPHDVPVGPAFFATRSAFSVAPIGTGSSQILLGSLLDSKLVDDFLRAPRTIYTTLTPRQFEIMVAELFDAFGFDVELTAPTRDQGRDVIAIAHRGTPGKFLIEAKRYAPTGRHRVGLAAVQRLLGVTVAENGTRGILATTSELTGPANSFVDQHPLLLEGRNLEGVTSWLESYQRLKLRHGS